MRQAKKPVVESEGEEKPSGGDAGEEDESAEDSPSPQEDNPCGSRPGRTAEKREGAMESLRKFRAGTATAFEYQATFLNPYFDDGSLIEVYADDHGYEYWVDPNSDLVVQVGPGAGERAASHSPRPADRLPVAELRARAVATLEANVPGFAKRKSSLHPLEDNRRREIYFFRWDDFSEPVKDGELPPFVQVGIWADGKLASFTNTLRSK